MGENESMEEDERDRILNRLRDGTIQAVASCQLLLDGYDFPGASVAVMLRPTKSLILWLQACGRVLRPAAGKASAMILDHVNNTALHGAPWLPRKKPIN